VLAFDSLAAAQRCPVPGLLVLAARPSFLDPAALATLPEHWQVAQVVGSGHFVQLVVPDQVNAMIDRFLTLLPAR
jgi:pimeloyl-ACP methyl ester carboxylesterase